MTEQEQMLNDCVNRESKLTDWERTFLDSLEKQLTDGRVLSERQVEVLDRIWERVT